MESLSAGLGVVVCAKPVPEGAASAAYDRRTGSPDRSGCLVLDDADAVGVELALRLVESAGGGRVAVVALTPPSGHRAVRSALAMGASRAIVVSDDSCAGSDALGTARVLAAAVREAAAGFDLLVAGTESTDGSAGVLPVQLAELLGLPAVTFARAVAVDPGARELRAERVTATGWDEVACPLPCLVTVVAGAVAPRYPSVRGIMGARAKPFTVLDTAALGMEAGAVGWAGSGQEVVGVSKAPGRGAGEVVDDAGTGHERILARLRELGAVG